MLATENNARWGILLAGGEGTRMRPLIRSWLGENRPKQYCTFDTVLVPCSSTPLTGRVVSFPTNTS